MKTSLFINYESYVLQLVKLVAFTFLATTVFAQTTRLQISARLAQTLVEVTVSPTASIAAARWRENPARRRVR